MKTLINLFLSLAVVGCTNQPLESAAAVNNKLLVNTVQPKGPHHISTHDIILKIKSKLHEHKVLKKQKIVIFVDYSMPINTERFFVYNTQKERIVYTTFVGHANRSGPGYATIFSNTPATKKSSLGLYKIGNTYVGRYGKSRRVHGLSKSNSNAHKRAIVIHAMPGVTPDDLYSWGCFTFFKHDYEEVLSHAKKGRYMVVSKL